jgi:tripeptide aminopeptidase
MDDSLEASAMVAALAARPAIAQALHDTSSWLPKVVEEALTLHAIPAPTFSEHERGASLGARMAQLGLHDVAQDHLGNVYARTPGADPDAPAVMVSAHLDTVFPLGASLIARHEADTIHAPGIGDNSLGLASLWALAGLLDAHAIHPAADLWWVATVGEEGLGNLRGMREAMERLRERVGLAIIIEGMSLGRVYHAGLSVRRLRIEARGEGGHSWLHYGRPSAIHHIIRLGEAILSQVEIPTEPRSSLNIGLIDGGTTVNTIAAEANMTIDLRSVDPSTLNAMAGQITAIVESTRREPDLEVKIVVVGERPGAVLPVGHPLPQAAGAALAFVGEGEGHFDIGSTDANIPLAMGIPSVCVGVTYGGNAHRVDEFIQVKPIIPGLKSLLLVVLAAAEHSREWACWDIP